MLGGDAAAQIGECGEPQFHASSIAASSCVRNHLCLLRRYQDRRLRPQPTQRHSREAIAEAEASLAGVQDDPGLEPAAKLVTQVTQSREILCCNGCCCLDLDPCHLTAAELEHDIHLALLLVTVVKHRCCALCPVALARKLHRGKRLKDWAGESRACDNPRSVDVHQVREQPCVDHVNLWRLHLAAAEVRVPRL